MGFSAFSVRSRAALASGFTALALLFAAPANAGPIEDALAAGNAGNYAGALEILEPLSRRGHPDDPMQQDADARVLLVILADRFRTQLFNEGEDEAEYQNIFNLAYQIARDTASSETVVNWGMRFYLARIYLYAAGSTAEQGETAIAMLRDVAASGDRVYANHARTTLCDEWIDEYCDQ